MRLVTTKYKLICNILFAMFWVLVTYNFVTQEATGDEVPAVEFGVRLLAQSRSWACGHSAHAPIC